MRFTVLVDNLPHGDLAAEWGLAVLLELADRTILLDGGAGGVLTDNAAKLGVDLRRVDAAVLSHAHYDHADGLAAFGDINPSAKLYLRPCGENCYDCSGEQPRYIGIRPGLLEEYAQRLVWVEDDFPLGEAAWLVGHKTPGLAQLGEQAGMCVEEDGVMRPEDFAHEQSLVVETAHGLVIFNSCSHGGADNIIAEVQDTFPGRSIYAYVGGLHLFKSDDAAVLALAAKLRETGVEHIYTGHCTGDRAIELLRQELGERVQQIYTGLSVVID